MKKTEKKIAMTNGPTIKDKVESVVMNADMNLIKEFQMREQNTKQLLAKAAPLFTIDQSGKVSGPSFISTIINWKLIIQIIIELIYKYIDANKSDKMLWDSNKK